jgi:hypothetical protein
MSSNKYIKFIDLSLLNLLISVLKRFSLEDWTFIPVNILNVFILNISFLSLFYWKYISTDYRDLVELVDLMSSIKEKLDLDKVPHYTTLQKFLSRILSSWFNLIFSKTLKLFYSHGEKAFITVYHGNWHNWIYELICKSLLF